MTFLNNKLYELLKVRCKANHIIFHAVSESKPNRSNNSGSFLSFLHISLSGFHSASPRQTKRPLNINK